MNERRRFLKVLGAGLATSVIGPACGGSIDDGNGLAGAGEAGGTSGAGGSGGEAGVGAAAGDGGNAGDGGSGGPGGSDAAGGAGGEAGSGGAAGGMGEAGNGGAQGGSAGAPTATCVASPTGVAVGAPSDFVTNGLHFVKGTKVLVGRDGGGLYARSSLCTHQLCNMDLPGYGKILSNGGIVCECHGSRFDALGNVTQGPAQKPLAAVLLVLGCDGKLYADASKKVAATDRVDA